jgi:preprotein translocase subunit SecG
MLFTFVTISYVIVCFFLVGVVLLQSGKGGGLGSAFGGGGGGAGQQVFGGAGAGNILTKLTAISAALFMLLSILLAYLSSSGDQGLDVVAAEQAAIAAAEDAEEEASGAEAEGEDGASGVDGEEPPAGAQEFELQAPTEPAPVEDDGLALEAPDLDLNPTEPAPAAQE